MWLHGRLKYINLTVQYLLPFFFQNTVIKNVDIKYQISI